ncbi:MAG: apolipoprotein N-acyltransferase [Thermoanaerobaculia bacterium]
MTLVGGLLWALCFGRETLPLASWLALAPLVLLLARRWSWALGWLHGLIYWLVAIPWIRPTLETYGGLPTWLASVSLLLLCLYLGAYHGLFALLGAPLWRRGGVVAITGLPALWVALEWLRAHLFSGFPWNLAAYAWTEVAGALPIAAWIGAYGVSFLLLVANVGTAVAVTRRSRLPGVAAVLACLLALAIGARWGDGSRSAGGVADGGGAAGSPVRLLQPNTENQVTWDPVAAQESYRRIFDLSHRACDEAGALLVWPESAAWPYSWGTSGHLRRDLEALAESGCTVLFNSTDQRREGYYNSVLLLGREGVAGRYDKRHLVPFGEYVPLARVFFFLEKIARNAGAYVAGSDVTPLEWGGERLGPAVCFEVVFPAEVAEQVRAGATVLVTVTNDAWYGDSSAPWQHFRAVRFRAAETRRPFLRAALTGISAVVEADGSVRRLLGVGEEGLIRTRIRGRTGLSPYARRPSLVPAGASILALFAIFLARRRGP